MTFYRKEREEVFRNRFERVAGLNHAWRLRTPTIFECKLRGAKKVVVKVDGRESKYHCRVSGASLCLTPETPADGHAFVIEESEVAGIMRGHFTIKKAMLDKLCRDHAMSSVNSPFISGCVVNNFPASSAYPGRKLAIELWRRKPFENPHVSGLEREYFLIGRLTSIDCRQVKYLGDNSERRLVGELVNFPGSRLPRRKI